jgi:hypothetical protein
LASADARAIGSVGLTSSRMIPKTDRLALLLQGFLKNTPNGRLRRIIKDAIQKYMTFYEKIS